jgi:hypothetical protein
MRLRRLWPALAVGLLAGCHKLTGYEENTYGEATFRHYAGLDLGYRITMTLCALAVVGGLVVLVTGMRRLDRSEQAWGVTLMLLAVVAATTASVGFGDVGECC